MIAETQNQGGIRRCGRSRVGLFAGLTNATPPNNITEMTDDERKLIIKWAWLP